MYIDNLRVNNTEDHSTTPLKDFVEGVEYSSVPDAADQISRLVKRSIQFQPKWTAYRGIRDEDFGTDARSDCYGFALATSEALSHIEVPHYVGYANGHVLTFVHDDDRSLWIIDGLSPCLNSNITSAVLHFDLEKARAQTEETGRSVFRIDSSILSNSVKLRTNFEELSSKNPWLTKQSSIIRDERTITEKNLLRIRTIIVTTMLPEVGRRAVRAMRNAHASILAGDMDTAYVEITSISGLFPEVDSRNKLPEIRQLIGALAVQGDIDKALAVAKAISDSRTPDISTDIRLRTWHGDALRTIGRIAANPAILHQALDAYTAIDTASPLVIGKVKKTHRMLSVIDQK